MKSIKQLGERGVIKAEVGEEYAASSNKHPDEHGNRRHGMCDETNHQSRKGHPTTGAVAMYSQALAGRLEARTTKELNWNNIQEREEEHTTKTRNGE